MSTLMQDCKLAIKNWR